MGWSGQLNLTSSNCGLASPPAPPTTTNPCSARLGGNANLTVNFAGMSVTVGAQSGTVTYGTGGSVTFPVTVSRAAAGAAFSAALTIGTLPAGATGSFLVSPLVFLATDLTKSTTLTIITTNTTFAGTATPFTVTATNTVSATDNASGDGALTVNKLAITVTAVTDTKTYDGTTSSSGVPTIVPALVNGNTSGFIQTFDNRNFGTGKTLTASGTVNDGNSGNNYAPTFVSVATGVINKRAITVTAATNMKVYDGTTTSAGVPTITVGSLAPGDSVTWTQTFDTKNFGTDKTLTPAGTVTDGNSGLNYTVTFAAVNTGVINKRPITVTAATDTKTYDGTTTSAGVPTITVGSLAPGDSVTSRRRSTTATRAPARR